MEGIRNSAVRSVPSPMHITHSMRAPETPQLPSRRDVLRRWEEMDDWSCAYCDSPFGPTVVAEVDHVTPIARSGVHEWFNLTLACALCNRVKGDAEPVSWLSENAGQGSTVQDCAATQRS